MLENALPVLPVLIPLVMAALCALSSSPRIAYCVTSLASLLTFISAYMLFAQNLGVTQNYPMGGHRPPFGIEYRFDDLNRLIVLIIAFIGAVMMPYARKNVAHELPDDKIHLFYSVYLLCMAGLIGIVSTNDIFNLYVFLEISSLATYSLIAMGKDRRALTASYQYLIVGTIGATFILIGIGLLYAMTGTLNITDMANRVSAVNSTRPVVAAYAFLTIGLALKIALFPLHSWLTNAYAFSPSFATAFLASTATKVSVYVFLRLIYTLFGFDLAFSIMPLSMMLVVFAVANILIGSVNAVYQYNIKRLLAFSSIAQIGYIILGIALATEIGLAAGIVHIANHALAKGLLFLCVGAVFMCSGGMKIQHFYGAGKYMPYTMAAFVIGGASLIGIPGTAGFISKWTLMQALLEKGWWPLAVLVIFSSLFAVIYIWRVVQVAYFRPRPEQWPPLQEASAGMLFSIYALVFANVYFGIDTRLTLDTAYSVANDLMNFSVISGGIRGGF